jgi:hypothetical protein
MVMIEKETSPIDDRGYSLIVTERSPGWCVHIFPGRHGLRHTHPDRLLGSTKEEALAKARATVEVEMSGHCLVLVLLIFRLTV